MRQEDSPIYLQQFLVDGLGHGSYLIGDEAARAAAVIDPLRDVDAYLAAAQAAGLAIRHVLETHAPNDYVSGARELAALAGAHLWASGAGGGAGLQYEHRPLRDGDAVEVGALAIRAWETPGHSPEHLAYLLFSRETGADAPLAVFSGGSLMVGGAGRTDLAGDERTRDLARAQFRSVGRLLSLPDHVAVYPTHGGGSFCGGGRSGRRWSTIGAERSANPLARCIAKQDPEEFAAALLRDLPVVPAYWARMRPLNQQGPRPLGAVGATPGLANLLPARPLTPRELRELLDRGAVSVVDAREPAGYGGAHIAGSFGVGLTPSFGVWVGSVVPNDRPIALVLPGDTPAALVAAWDTAVRQLLRAGYDRIAGYLAGGIRSWATEGFPFETLPQLSAREAAALLQRGQGGLLDVRQPAEWTEGHAPGATHLPAAALPNRLTSIDRERSWAVTCSSGYRSTIAASLLRREGIRAVANVLGGMAAWEKAGLPQEPAERG
ncbi:MAG: MBL fold metallo-hydrolase [Chloroflexi bacterium]|nr:MBL fold metallo-hydrolase [Chloroflexota bacterium]